MRNLARALFCVLFAITGLAVAPAANAVESGSTEGCTPGYWKAPQHFDSWQEADPDTLFVHAFRTAQPQASGDMAPVGVITEDLTMIEALNFTGGSGLDGARRILARAAVAAWLNAAYDEGDHLQYPWRRWGDSEGDRPSLVAAVVEALSGTDRQAMLDLAAQLDEDNNLGCPLS